ncbi:MAG: alpha/beta hydrolase [Solirubrobacterales bacterium]|nr:alpha/beta hydrolase [Solirubrobacterales bacterium]MBV9365538.1 alpha/beta hydrolase [Solirubrobacterales bacterium]
MPRTRTVTPELPSEIGVYDGLSYSLWLPNTPARGGVVVLHGAGSRKESHYDFARRARGAGLAALVFDQRGHGESDGPMDGRALDDVGRMTDLLRSRTGTHDIALRGSSMGGYLALISAQAVNARAVVAVCPAGAEGLRRGLAQHRFAFVADVAALDAVLATHDEHDAMAELENVPVLILHAEGDEQVPVEHSRELAALARSARSRLIAVSGGHHRSVQHDPDLQAASLRFIERALAAPLT